MENISTMESQSPFKSWREAKGLSISEAAEQAGVNHSTWFRWENGTLSVGAKSVIAVEAATGISRHDLRPDVFGPKTEAAA